MNRRSLFSAFLLTVLSGPSYASFIENIFNKGKSWDVIVVGAGAAGLSAAVEAADNGASVLLLESQPEIGGNTLISGGFYASVDKKRQEKQGITDSVELHVQQTYDLGGRLGDPKLVRTMVTEAQESLEWLEKLGMHFQPRVFELYGAHWPRAHIPVLPLGQGYIRTLADACVKRGVELKVKCEVREILIKENKVVGVSCYCGNEYKQFYASRGVVLAAGSFAANPDLIQKISPKLKGLTTNNAPGSNGLAMLAAEKVGAKLVNLEFIQCLPGCPPGKKYRVRFHNDVSHFIFVNKNGERFIREDSPRDEFRDAVLSLPEKYGFIIIDDEGFRRAGILVQKEAVKAIEGGEAWKGETLEELAGKMGVPADNLIRTVEDYNEGERLGKDRLGKKIHSLTLPIAHPPFWACYAGMTVHYTEGGIAIDEKARVLNKKNQPIDGLYAAGTITGNVHGKNRLGANGLADAIVFGRIAGRQAAKN